MRRGLFHQRVGGLRGHGSLSEAGGRREAQFEATAELLQKVGHGERVAAGAWVGESVAWLSDQRHFGPGVRACRDAEQSQDRPVGCENSITLLTWEFTGRLATPQWALSRLGECVLRLVQRMGFAAELEDATRPRTRRCRTAG
jgi:hypothetical protein